MTGIRTTTGGRRYSAEALQHVVTLLERVMPLAGLARRLVLQLLAVSLVAITVIGVLLWDRLDPISRQDIVVMVLLLGLLLIPAGVLLAYSIALHEVMELPKRLLDLPGTTAQTRDRLRGIAGSVRREQRGARSTVRSLWNLGVLIATARDALEIYAPIVAVINPLFLIALAASTIAVALEVFLAIGLLLFVLIL
jgi:hypothetical protein